MRSEVGYNIKSGFATGSRKNIISQWRAYLSFCLYFGLDTAPCSVDTLLLYIAFLARSFVSPQSIRNYLSGVSLFQEFHGMPIGAFQNLRVKLLLRGIARNKKHSPKQAKPITLELLLKIRTVLDFESQKDISFWASLLIAFYLMLRKSNLIPWSFQDFDYKRHLSRCHFSIGVNYMLVQIVWSKTIQFGERVLLLPLSRIKNSCLCPVAAIENLFTTVQAPLRSSAFSFFHEGQLTLWTEGSWVSYLKEKLALFVKDTSNFSGHSFRRGGATFAFQAGIPSDLIQLYGDWRSDAYKNYIHCNLDQKLQVAHLIKQNIEQNTACI